jgi:NTP pyrophosphatase (non-canonical NTP hydrolase)
MTDTEEITKSLVEFRDQRQWGKFHNPKDLALALNIESAELLEAFLWKSHTEVKVEKIKEELADVFAYAFLLAERYDLDVKQILLSKIKLNGLKYPVESNQGVVRKSI